MHARKFFYVIYYIIRDIPFSTVIFNKYTVLVNFLHRSLA